MMKKTKIILPALAVILVIGLMVGPALAYFTAHVDATGKAEISLGSTTTITEEFEDLNKLVTIHNDGPQAVWVRARAYSVYTLSYSGTNWNKEGDWYVYQTPVEAKNSTQPLNVSITTELDKANDANIIVVYECTPVMYDDATGAQLDPDWTLVVNPEEETTSADTNASDNADTTDSTEEEETTKGGES